MQVTLMLLPEWVNADANNNLSPCFNAICIINVKFVLIMKNFLFIILLILIFFVPLYCRIVKRHYLLTTKNKGIMILNSFLDLFATLNSFDFDYKVVETEITFKYVLHFHIAKQTALMYALLDSMLLDGWYLYLTGADTIELLSVKDHK